MTVNSSIVLMLVDGAVAVPRVVVGVVRDDGRKLLRGLVLALAGAYKSRRAREESHEVL